MPALAWLIVVFGASFETARTRSRFSPPLAGFRSGTLRKLAGQPSCRKNTGAPEVCVTLLLTRPGTFSAS